MELMHITTVPAKLATRDGLGKISEHLYITMSEKTASVIMTAEGQDSGLAIQFFVDMSDVEEEKLNQEHAAELSEMVMNVVSNLSEETVKAYISDHQMGVFTKCYTQATAEWQEVLARMKAPQNQSNMLTFMLTNKQIYSLNADELNWMDLINHVHEYIQVLQYIQSFWVELYDGSVTPEKINEAKDFIQDAFKKMGVDPNYSSCVKEDASLIEKLAPPIYDITFIYSQMITNIMMKRDSIIYEGRIQDLLEHLKNNVESEAEDDENVEVHEEPTEVSDADIIDEIADAAESIEAETVTEGE